MDGFEPGEEDLVLLNGTAYIRTSSQGNAMKGFQSCGLWPFDDNIFGDEEFATAEVIEEAFPAEVQQANMLADARTVDDQPTPYDAPSSATLSSADQEPTAATFSSADQVPTAAMLSSADHVPTAAPLPIAVPAPTAVTGPSPDPEPAAVSVPNADPAPAVPRYRVLLRDLLAFKAAIARQ